MFNWETQIQYYMWLVYKDAVSYAQEECDCSLDMTFAICVSAM